MLLRLPLAPQVLLPYLKAKCDRLYARHAQQQGGVLGLALARSGHQQQQVGGCDKSCNDASQPLA